MLDYLRIKTIAGGEIRKHVVAPAQVIIQSWSESAHFWCEACREMGVPYYVLCHGLESIAEPSPWARHWRTQDLEQACGVIANSHATAGLVRSAARFAKIYVGINPGISPAEALRPTPEAQLAKRRELRLPENVQVLLSIGRLIKRKGFDLVIEAVAALAQDFPSLRYVVAGEGEERSALEALATRRAVADRVVLLGEVPDRDKWALLGLCDALVMPNRTLAGSDWEGFGIVFLEAGLAERPVIGGNNAGVTDAIEHRGSGLLVDPESPADLREAIRYVLVDSERAKKMGRRGKERVLSEFTWERRSSVLLDLLSGGLGPAL